MSNLYCLPGRAGGSPGYASSALLGFYPQPIPVAATQRRSQQQTSPRTQPGCRNSVQACPDMNTASANCCQTAERRSAATVYGEVTWPLNWWRKEKTKL